MNSSEKEVVRAELKSEREMIDKLRENYKEALKDIKQEIKELEKQVQGIDGDDEISQSIITSKMNRIQIAKAKEEEITEILSKLNDINNELIENYMKDMYVNGHAGQLYNLMKEYDIPVLAPINTSDVMIAINKKTDDLKFSDRLYKDMVKTKETVIQELTRGFTTGMSNVDIARNISQRLDISMKNAYRIARTEGGRVQIESSYKAMKEAKKKGVDLVKQWVATLDGKTRPVHQELDSQIAELDKPFKCSWGEVEAPRHFGDPSQDINCRCRLTSMPRWAVSGTTIRRDNITGEIVDVKNYADWINKYHLELFKDSENGGSSLFGRVGANDVNLKYINSKEYRAKFNKLTSNTKVNDVIRNQANAMLTKNNGKDEEDLVFISKIDGKILGKWHTKSLSFNDEKDKKEMIQVAINHPNKIIAMHNHPTNIPPTGSDFVSSGARKYVGAIVTTHDGKVYYYKHGDKPFSAEFYDKKLESNTKVLYNQSVIKAHEKTQEMFRKDYGIVCKELK